MHGAGWLPRDTRNGNQVGHDRGSRATTLILDMMMPAKRFLVLEELRQGIEGFRVIMVTGNEGIDIGTRWNSGRTSIFTAIPHGTTGGSRPSIDSDRQRGTAFQPSLSIGLAAHAISE